MMELFAWRLNLDDKSFGKSEWIAAVGQGEVLVPTVTDRIDGAAVDFRLQALDNVVLLSHMGSARIKGRIAMGEKVIISIETFGGGHRAPDRVIGSMLWSIWSR
jgi:hypothetical protein